MEERKCPLCLAPKPADTFAVLSVSRRDNSGVTMGVCDDCSRLVESAPLRLLSGGGTPYIHMLEKQ